MPDMLEPSGSGESLSEPEKDWRLRVYAGGDGTGRRRKPSAAERPRILEQQNNRCLYCDRPFGSVVYRHGRATVLKVEWDHFIPFSYSQRNPDEDFVAACQVCNRIKGALVFDTPISAIEFVRTRRFQKGYRP